MAHYLDVGTGIIGPQAEVPEQRRLKLTDAEADRLETFTTAQRVSWFETARAALEVEGRLPMQQGDPANNPQPRRDAKDDEIVSPTGEPTGKTDPAHDAEPGSKPKVVRRAEGDLDEEAQRRGQPSRRRVAEGEGEAPKEEAAARP